MAKKKTTKQSQRRTAGSNIDGGNTLVIVESPAKARTITKYLGSQYTVESSIGHIRDLPSKASEIPAEIKQEEWARLGVNVEDRFEPLYIIPPGKKGQVAKLRKILKKASKLYLATDEDREGEAIAWHLREVLAPEVPVRRMVFDEITEEAIQAALNQTRDIDMKLVNAQEARRILDRLFGYEVSPILWRKIAPKLSAGRVQSVATRLIVERERARMLFKAAEYWDLEAILRCAAGSAQSLNVKLVDLADERIAIGKDFDDSTGQLKNGSAAVWLNASQAESLASELHGADFTVRQITEKPFVLRPHAPFITSSLQQEANRKLGFTAQRTMRAAQSLYENGYITYMRTDSTNLSGQAIHAARQQISDLYGESFVPDKPRAYSRKVKNAQEAHEAIRPAGSHFRKPQQLRAELQDDAYRIYELIWKRTIASQMKDATGQRTQVRFEAPTTKGQAGFSASGKVFDFHGFLRAYVEGADDPKAELEDQEKVLPLMKEGERFSAQKVEALQHTTLPPARFTEASLISELEQRGIGRPSTYASIIQTIQDRGYVWKKDKALVPTFTAFAVVQLMERYLEDLIDFDFTARMEDDLDAIADGQQEYVPWLHDFYFGQQDQERENGSRFRQIGLKTLIGQGVADINPREVASVLIGKTENGEDVSARVGRYGPYVQIGDTDQRATIPDDIPPDELTMEKAMVLIEQASGGDKILGRDPGSGKDVYLKVGRFGPYVQLGEPELTEKGTVRRGGKPKMASVWPTLSPETLTLDQALMLLSYPKSLGKHPETGEEITAQDGRFGPYIKMGSETRSLGDHDRLAAVTLDDAIELLKQPKGRRAATQVLAEIGKHPKSGETIQAKSGRYGPYVTDGVVNATIPKGVDPADITVEKAVEWLDAREQKMREQGKDPRAKKVKKATRTGRKKSTGKKVPRRKSG